MFANMCVPDNTSEAVVIFHRFALVGKHVHAHTHNISHKCQVWGYVLSGL